MKKDNTKKTTDQPLLIAVFNWLVFIEIIAFGMLFIAVIWFDYKIIIKLILSDIILFALTLFLYSLCCDKKDK